MLDDAMFSSSLASLLLLLAGVGFIYIVSLTIYRIFFHPLTHFPGPKLAAATYWYDFYYDVLKGPFPGRGNWEVERLHEIYGPIVRINPDEIAVKDPYWFETLYNSGRCDKWPRNHRANGSAGSVATTISQDLHRIRKAPLLPFFSKRAVVELEPLINEKVEQLCDGLRGFMKRGEPLEAGRAFTALTLDIITDYCFGDTLGCLKDPELSPQWKATMAGLFETVPVTKQFPWIPQFMAVLPRAIVERMAPDMALFLGARDKVHKQVVEIVETRKKSEIQAASGKGPSLSERETQRKSKTIFHELLNSSLPESEKQVDRLTDEGFVMFVAGSETTSKILATLFYHLLANPSALARIRKEVDEVMPDPNIIPKWRQLEQLPFFNAAIHESLRLSSAVMNRLQLIRPHEALMYQNWVIPPGTPISMSVPFIMLDSNIFTSPTEFDPERWIRSAEQGLGLEQFQLTFHKGPRSCPGQNLALAELYLTTVALIRRFEFKLFDTVRERDIDAVRDCFVGMSTPGSKGLKFVVERERDGLVG